MFEQCDNKLPNVDPDKIVAAVMRKNTEERIAFFEGDWGKFAFRLRVQDSEDVFLESNDIGRYIAEYIRDTVRGDGANGPAFSALTYACRNFGK